MTRPRWHAPSADGPASFSIDIDGVQVNAEQFLALTRAYQADHPDWTPPRPGIRGSAARLALRTLPEGWAEPYWHVI